MRNFNNELSGQGLIKSTLEYFPSSKKKAINTKSDGLSGLGLSLFRVPGTGTETDADARRFVKANQPSTWDNDYEFLGKLYNLIGRIDARVAQMGLPPIQWEQPKDVVMQQFFALPEEDRAAIGMPAEAPATQADAATQAAAAEQADTTTALPSNAAFAAPIGVEAAEFGGDKTSIPIPPEMQQEMNEWFAKNPRGSVGLKAYSNFRRALDAKYGFGRDKPYEDDPNTIEFLKQYNDPKLPVNVAIPPVTGEDKRNMLERAAGTAVMNPFGTAVATGVSGLGLNLLDAALPEMAALREMNPNAALAGDIIGSIGGNAALRNVGNFGLSKLLSQAPELQKYVEGGGKIADYARDFAGDMTGDVIQGITYGGAVEGDAGTGAVSAAGGNLLGRGFGGAGNFILGGSSRSPVAQKLMDDYGIEDLTIGQQYGGFPKTIEDAATSIPGIGDIINARRGESVLDLNRAAFREVGGAPVGYGDVGVQALTTKSGQAYDKALAGKTFDLSDTEYTQAMADALANRAKLTEAFGKDFDVAIKNSITDTPIGRSLIVPGEAYKEAQRAISGYKGAKARTGFEQDYRDALGGVSDALREMVERQDPTLVPLLREADTMYRGKKILENAVERAETDPTGLGAGVFSPGNLTQAVRQSGKRYPGDVPLRSLSRLAQNVIPSDVPDSGSARRLALTGLAAAGLGGITGGGLGYDAESGFGDLSEDAVYGAGYTMAPLAVLGALGSRSGQKMLSNLFFERPELMKSAATLADLTGKYKYVPDRLVAPTLMPILMPEGRDDPVVATRAERAAAEKAAAAQAAAAQAEAAAETEEVPLKGTITDPRTGRQMVLRGDRFFYVDTGEPADIDTSALLDSSDPARGMCRGGTVRAFNKGGNKGEKKRGYDYGNAARTFAQGVTAGTGDEIEGFARSLFSGRPYKTERDEIRRLQERYALANPNTAMALEGAGMIGSSLLMPSVAGMRAVANAPRLTRIAASGVDDLAQGIAYTAGKSKEMRDIPRDIRKDAAGNAIAFGVATGAEQSGRTGGRYLAGKAASTKPGYQAALTLKRLMSKY
ncbi:hypothetical protein UFOVP714_40 [uncultured Caudovirales phage]|uniref:Uncharacterized protein n=1 Tax=uncultured Caudovirales phage TaxID=2100421 RepID=A0A6J5NIX5_9CAUD|nr:hypothetical protein UFOVP714_40 [uncultured Caudovirales phage]CAB4167450.1 hypothetical protein UFOVP864_20 [uncultured Caudovirales phage]